MEGAPSLEIFEGDTWEEVKKKYGDWVTNQVESGTLEVVSHSQSSHYRSTGTGERMAISVLYRFKEGHFTGW
jgi:hypothetical protein